MTTGFTFQKPKTRVEKKQRGVISFLVAPEVEDMLDEIAEREETTRSEVVRVFLEVGLKQYQAAQR